MAGIYFISAYILIFGSLFLIFDSAVGIGSPNNAYAQTPTAEHPTF